MLCLDAQVHSVSAAKAAIGQGGPTHARLPVRVESGLACGGIAGTGEAVVVDPHGQSRLETS